MDLISKTFDSSVAKVVGTDAAIILQNIEFWQAKNAKNDQGFKDGRYWTYSTVQAFCDLFDYLTAKQIRTALEKLEKSGFIVTGVYNKANYDRTKWYSSTRLESLCPNGKMESSILSNGSNQKGTPIPYINTDIKSIYNIKMSDVKISSDRKQLITKKETVNCTKQEIEIFEIAEHFRKLFIKNLNDREAPTTHQDNATFKNYFIPIKNIITIDKCTFDHLRNVYKYLNSNDGDFWKPNILSTSKLRTKMPQLIVSKYKTVSKPQAQRL